MRIDSHAHGAHAETDKNGRLCRPVVSAWRNAGGRLPAERIAAHNARGVEAVLLLDPVDIVFELKRDFGDFALASPQVEMDRTSPEEIAAIFDRGARGIKFIAPERPYGDHRYLPLYETVRDCRGLAVFHTGYLGHGLYEPGCIYERPFFPRITDMRPAELDRISRVLPDLKILMAHFGNPWWEEAWTLLKSGRNIFADFSGGTAIGKPMGMWKELFAPNGRVNHKVVSKLCYGSDVSLFVPDDFAYQDFMDFHDALYDGLKLPEEIRQRIDRGNIQELTSRR